MARASWSDRRTRMQEGFLLRNGEYWLFNACGAVTQILTGRGTHKLDLPGAPFPELMSHRKAYSEVVSSALLSNIHVL